MEVKWKLAVSSDQMTSTYKSYKSKVSLPLCIKDILLSSDASKATIFRDLSNKLLEKCLHNYTQNQNN